MFSHVSRVPYVAPRGEMKTKPTQHSVAALRQVDIQHDALVLRAGFARTTAQARQMVVHRHILVDGKIVDRPSFRMKPGQLVHVKERSEGTEPFQVAAAGGHAEVLQDALAGALGSGPVRGVGQPLE